MTLMIIAIFGMTVLSIVAAIVSGDRAVWMLSSVSFGAAVVALALTFALALSLRLCPECNKLSIDNYCGKCGVETNCYSCYIWEGENS